MGSVSSKRRGRQSRRRRILREAFTRAKHVVMAPSNNVKLFKFHKVSILHGVKQGHEAPGPSIGAAGCVQRLTCWDPYLSESIDLTDQVFPTLASE